MSPRAKDLRLALPIQIDRRFAPRLAGHFAQSIEASGVVDEIQVWDQLTHLVPNTLWGPDTTPLATEISDCDSWPDAFVVSAFALAATNQLGVSISTDAIRRPPVELMQTMMTLANATQGNATLMLGAGEAKQTQPFGHDRRQGLARLEDHLRVYRLLAECQGPVDFEGHVWKLRDAWIGAGRPFLPRMWAMGAGARLMEIALRHADGFSTIAPGAVARPADWAEFVTEMKANLADGGRAPEKFGFGIWAPCLIHPDPSAIERAQQSPILRFYAACAGRLSQAHWKREEIEPVLPVDWHYARDLLPTRMSRKAALDIAGAVPERMVERSFIAGSPAEVALQLNGFVEAGATWMSVIDLLPVTLPLEDALLSLDHSIDVCRRLKAL